MRLRILLVLLCSMAGAWAGSEVGSFTLPLVEIQGGTNQTTYTTGDILYASGSNTLAKLGIGSSTNVLTVSGGIPAWSAASSGITNTAIYGDGSDGSLTLDGSTTILGMAPSSNVYTQTRDITCTSMTVNNGVTLITSGYRVFGNGTLTNNGTIHNNGSVGAAGTSGVGGGGGAGGAGGYFIAGKGGGAGANGTAGTPHAGTAGGNATSTIAGAGGHGGSQNGTSSNGGPGGTAVDQTPSNLSSNSIRSLTSAFTGWTYKGSAPGSDTGHQIGAGAGGGGGGTQGFANDGGGGGGGGGGTILVAFKTITNTSGTISANGGKGGSASGTGPPGKGAGGGGGMVIYVYNTFSGNVPTATAGASGTSGGTLGLTNATDGVVIALLNNN